MLKALAIAGALVVSALSVAAADPRVPRVIDLDRPGALEALQRSNPAHYDKVRKIVAGVGAQRDPDVPRWIQANFAGRDVQYAPIVMTSFPPQRRLAFALDDTRYQTVVTLTNVRGDVVPLK